MPRHIHILVNLMALFVISYLAVDLSYDVAVMGLNRFGGSQVEKAREISVKRPGQAAVPAYDQIRERNIFGATEKVELPPAVETKPVETLEETTLQLSLLGTIAGDTASARAIIMDKRQRSQDIYRVGDSVQNAEIRQILRGKVILRHGGNDEILSMVEGGEKSQAAPGADLQRPTASRPAERLPGRTPVGGMESGEPETETIQLSQAVLQSSMNNLSDLMTQVRVRPYFRRGKPEGIIVSQIQTNSIFAQLGLMNGDIIASVNGRQMSTPEEAFQFYSSLKSGENVNIEITRRGQKKVLTYDIQ